MRPASSVDGPAVSVGSAGTYSLACHACGRCCNSPPALSLRELFRHGERFVGSIVIAKVAGLRIGERVSVEGRTLTVDAEDVAAFDALADRLYSRIVPGRDWLSVSVQGFDYPSLERCPALADDGRCSVHDTGKPAICDAVPLDPFSPDRWQPLLLAARRDTAIWMGADCLHAGRASNATLLIDSGRLVATHALAAHRDALAIERAVWRDSVASLLAAGGADWARTWARLAPGARLTLPIAPALLEVARRSPRCRDACVALVDRQIELIETKLAAALARRLAADRETTRELRGFAEVLRRARVELIRHADDGPHATDSAEVETWLGLN